MPKKITISYEIADDMSVSFSSEIKELAKYGSLNKFKSMTKKYLSEIDNQMNVKGKILKAGRLEFEVQDNNIEEK